MVYVLNQLGQPLMPTKDHRKVRILLSNGKAKVVKRTPFTIQLLTRAKTYVQPVTLGVDAGSKHVGLSASTEREELFVAELQPRNDVVDNLSTRRQYRRTRRNRKTRYRKPRFMNRVHSKHKGWLAPSVEVKIHNHIQAIKLAIKILPVSLIRVETAEFDLQRLKAMIGGNQLPVGTDYQMGEMYGEHNVRQYVLHRDGYKCLRCKAKPTSENNIKLHVHHLESRKIGGNAPSNLITLCESCHKAYHKGLIKLPDKIKHPVSLKDATFMGIMRKTLIGRLRSTFSVLVEETYGYITKAIREKHGIIKTHTSDARCIAKHPEAKVLDTWYLIKPVRSHNRQIHKAKISKGGKRKLNQAPKYVFGFQLFDKVLTKKEEGFIFGRRSSGSFDIRRLDGRKISAGISYKKIKLLETRKTILIDRRNAVSSPWLKPGVSTAKS